MTQNPATPSDKRDATARPWKVGTPSKSTYNIVGVNGGYIATVYGKNRVGQAANAALIAHAVNTLPAHEECVEALRLCLKQMTGLNYTNTIYHTLDAARKALASVAALGEVS